jgi:hypothetical protein
VHGVAGCTKEMAKYYSTVARLKPKGPPRTVPALHHQGQAASPQPSCIAGNVQSKPVPQSNVHWLLAVLGSPHHCRVTGRPSLGAGHVAYAADDTAKLSKLALEYWVEYGEPEEGQRGVEGPREAPCRVGAVNRGLCTSR